MSPNWAKLQPVHLNTYISDLPSEVFRCFHFVSCLMQMHRAGVSQEPGSDFTLPLFCCCSLSSGPLHRVMSAATISCANVLNEPQECEGQETVSLWPQITNTHQCTWIWGCQPTLPQFEYSHMYICSERLFTLSYCHWYNHYFCGWSGTYG